MCSDQTPFSELPDVRTIATIGTGKPRESTDITLVTQLSFERLHMLEGQCRAWTGVIAAAVHVPVVRGKAVVSRAGRSSQGPVEPQRVPLSDVLARLRAFHAQAEASALCKLDVSLSVQEFASVWLAGLYPVNTMRNRALALARTDVALLLDVDFWPSAELSELMLVPGKYASLAAAVAAGNAIVLPAFETSAGGAQGVSVARAAVAEGKPAAVRAHASGALKAFHVDRYSQGHRATDYGRWAASERPYRVAYQEGYEPYVIVARDRVPWCDERFVGYRKNKVVHLMHLASAGLQFVVHPRAFVVHAPHPRAATWKVTHKTGLWDAIGDMYADVKRKLAAGTYVPASRYACGDHLMGPGSGSLLALERAQADPQGRRAETTLADIAEKAAQREHQEQEQATVEAHVAQANELAAERTQGNQKLAATQASQQAVAS